VTVGVAEIPDNGSVTDRITFQVRPNPFQNRAMLYVGGAPIDNSFPAQFTVYNSTGQKIKTISGTARNGRLVCEWDATDHQGRSVPAGVYFVHLRVDGKSSTHEATERIVLVR
jgi:hypothetical protein